MGYPRQCRSYGCHELLVRGSKLKNRRNRKVKKRLACIGLSALFVLLGATQANLAFAGFSSIAHNGISTQNLSSKPVPVQLTANATTTPSNTQLTLGSGGWVTPSSVSTCNTKSVTATLTSGRTNITLTIGTTAHFITGMKITGTGIAANTTLTSFSSTTVARLSVNATASGSSVLTLIMPTCSQQFFYINNSGSTAVTTLGLVQKTDSTVISATTGTNYVDLQTCSGTWTTATGVCSGTTATFMTTQGPTTSPLTPVTVSVGANGSTQIRALATQTVRTCNINIIIQTNDYFPSGTNTNS